MLKTKKLLRAFVEPNEFSKKADNNNKWVDYITIDTKAPSNYIKDREANLANYKAIYKPVWNKEIISTIKVWVNLFVNFVSQTTMIDKHRFGAEDASEFIYERVIETLHSNLKVIINSRKLYLNKLYLHSICS